MKVLPVEKLVWAPAPFHSPCIGLGSIVTRRPKSSDTLCSRYLAKKKKLKGEKNILCIFGKCIWKALKLTLPSRGHHPSQPPHRGPPGTPTELASPRRGTITIRCVCNSVKRLSFLTLKKDNFSWNDNHGKQVYMIHRVLKNYKTSTSALVPDMLTPA